MRGRLKERARHVELANRDAERGVADLLIHDREVLPVLRLEAPGGREPGNRDRKAAGREGKPQSRCFHTSSAERSTLFSSIKKEFLRHSCIAKSMSKFSKLY